MQFTEHFDLAQFLVSQVAARQGRRLEPQFTDIENMRRLSIEILEPVRNAIRRPLILLSGFRPEWLNHAIGGSETSAHMWGGAGDCVAPGMTPLELAEVVASLELPTLDQCILEFPPTGWVHLGIARFDALARRQLLTASHHAGRTVYMPGLLA